MKEKRSSLGPRLRGDDNREENTTFAEVSYRIMVIVKYSVRAINHGVIPDIDLFSPRFAGA